MRKHVQQGGSDSRSGRPLLRGRIPDRTRLLRSQLLWRHWALSIKVFGFGESINEVNQGLALRALAAAVRVRRRPPTRGRRRAARASGTSAYLLLPRIPGFRVAGAALDLSQRRADRHVGTWWCVLSRRAAWHLSHHRRQRGDLSRPVQDRRAPARSNALRQDRVVGELGRGMELAT